MALCPRVLSIRPAAQLQSYIDRYWIFRHTGAQAPQLAPVTPGVGLDLFLHLASPFYLAGGESLPPAHILFSGTHSIPIQAHAGTRFIAVRFRAGALKKFTDLPLCELTDTMATPQDLWGAAGRELRERAGNAADPAALACNLDAFFSTMLNRYGKGQSEWQGAVDLLYRQFDAVTIDGMARSMNCSIRHFRRRFLEETGFTPKHFQQLARFHATLKPLLLGKEKKYLSAALDSGYFDQMHFIHAFRRFMGSAPGEFFQSGSSMSHFYYPSIPAGSSFVQK